MKIQSLFLLLILICSSSARDYFEDIQDQDNEATKFLQELSSDKDDYFQNPKDETLEIRYELFSPTIKENTPIVSEITKWIHKTLVSKNGDTVTIKANFARLRKEAKLDPNEKDYTAKRGDQFTYIKQKNNWYQIAIPDTFEYATTTTFQLGIVDSKGTVNLRLKPKSTQDSKVITTLKNSTKVQILKKSGDWYLINTDQKTGYMHSRHISKLNNFEENWTGGNITYDDVEPQINDTNSQASSSNTHSSASSDLLDNVIRNANGGIEVGHVPAYAQMGVDPFDPEGGKGWRPQAYCGVTSFQMVMAYHGVKKPRDYYALTNLKTGEDNVKSTKSLGQMYIKGTGSAYAPMVRMAKHLGYKNTKQVWKTSLFDMKKRVSEGRPQIVSVRGKVKHMAYSSNGTKDSGRSYHTNGHIMVVRGFTDDGDVIVNDPARGGKRRIIKASDFTNVWRGFTIDIKK
ncbi:MAG: hypothetical protein COB02_08095 [Candidatus Cloacimonadota bacterium]|nr:MAG: hypothetical protein COB02_08095 [Candidatus Cloacimonadota bacterium]